METYELAFKVEYKYNGNEVKIPCESKLEITHSPNFPFTCFIRELTDCIPASFLKKQFCSYRTRPYFSNHHIYTLQNEYEIETYRYIMYMNANNWEKLEKAMNKTIENIIKLFSKKFTERNTLLDTMPKPLIIKVAFDSKGEIRDKREKND